MFPMLPEVLYTLASVLVVSFVSLLGILSVFFRKKNNLRQILMLLVSLSAGTLFGGALLHLLPEAVEASGSFSLTISLTIVAGIVVFFILEKIVHMHHHHNCHDHDHAPVHEGKEHIGILNLMGDGLHNFLDGLIIAGSYLISIPLGIATTVAVILHEVPQELADFGVLLYAGFSKRKALLLNFISAAVAIIGAIIGLILGNKGETFIQFILPFAAGGFLYIAGSNLIPELHKHCKMKESMYHLIAMVAGIAIMVGLLYI
jgi:zinc and cadmium transporter